jgi:hypothetical protein
MPTYDPRFNPPAPMGTVTLYRPSDGRTVGPVTMLIDTGADATLLPRSAVEQLFTINDGSDAMELVSFDGAPHPRAAGRT